MEERLQRLPKVYNALARLGIFPPVRPVPPPLELEVYRRRSSPDVERAWRQVDRILGAMASETAAHESRFLIAYIPSRFEVSDRDLEVTRLWYGLDESSWGRAPVLRHLRAIGDARGIPVLDLTGPLRAVGGRGGYYEYDGHWNAAGHQAAAAATVRWLATAGGLPRCALPSKP